MNWKLFFQILFIGSPICFFIYWCYIKLTIPRILFHNLELFPKYSNIVRIDKTGFSMKGTHSPDAYYWKDITNITLLEDSLLIEIDLANGFEKLDYTDYKYFSLLYALSEYAELDISNFTENLETCEVCGNVAKYTKHNYCYGCHTDFDFEQEYKDITHEEFIKGQQINLFSILNKDKSVFNLYINKKPFAFNINWKPFITEKKLKRFQKRFYSKR